MPEPLILVDPQPRTLDMICDPPTRARLEALGRLVVSDAERMPAAQVDAHLPEAVAIVGQTDLPAERLARAPRLRAVINVEGNLLPNVDYAAARDRGIHVLVASSAFAPAVAEAALGMAIDLARGIGAADRAMRAGTETYGLDVQRRARSCSPARRSGSSGSATSAARCGGCSSRSAARCASTTRGCRSS